MSKIHEYTPASSVSQSDVVILDVPENSSYVNKSATIEQVNEACTLAKLDDVALSGTPSEGQVLGMKQVGNNLKIGNLTIVEYRSPTFTLTKTSGAWTVGSAIAKKIGNVVHVELTVMGDGTAVANSSNGFVGSINILKPVLMVRSSCYFSDKVLTCLLASDGSFTIRNSTGTSFTLSTGNGLTFGFAYITAD